MALEHFIAKVVDEMIPKRTGIALPTVSSTNDQISCSFRGIRSAGSIGDCVAMVCSRCESKRGGGVAKGRSAGNPGRFSKLLKTGLARLGHRVFANQQFGSKDCGSSSCDRPPLGETGPNDPFALCDIEQLGTVMPYPTPQNDVQINRVHTGAVCKEMGERLSVALGPQSIELQPCLLSLMKQLEQAGKFSKAAT